MHPIRPSTHYRRQALLLSCVALAPLIGCSSSDAGDPGPGAVPPELRIDDPGYSIVRESRLRSYRDESSSDPMHSDEVVVQVRGEAAATLDVNAPEESAAGLANPRIEVTDRTSGVRREFTLNDAVQTFSVRGASGATTVRVNPDGTMTVNGTPVRGATTDERIRNAAQMMAATPVVQQTSRAALAVADARLARLPESDHLGVVKRLFKWVARKVINRLLTGSW